MLTAVSVWAAVKPSTSIINWDSVLCAVDQEGVDDVNGSSETDITEFCVAADSKSYYVAMAVDDTGMTGKKSQTVGVRIDMDGDSIFDYIVLAEIAGDPASLKNYSIGSCDDSGVCSLTGDICQGNSCQSGEYPVMIGSGTDWPTSFGTHAKKCKGTDCESKDTFIEFGIPWGIFPSLNVDGKPGGPPSTIFLSEYRAFPSTADGIISDQQDAQGFGISCFDMSCQSASPSAVELSLLTSESPLTASFQIWGIFGLLTVFTSGFLFSRRRANRVI